MGGSGTLPDAAPAVRLAPQDETLDACVIGGGPAGPAAAARAIAEAAPGARVALYDEQAALGGSLLAESGGTARAQQMAAAARAAGARVVSKATAIGYYPEDPVPGGGEGVLAVVVGDRLLRVSARRWLYTTGSYDQNLPFPDNDRPGVIAARACGRLAFHWGVRPVAPKRRVVILDGAPTAARLERGLGEAGVQTTRVDLRRETVVGARSATRLRGVNVTAADGEPRKVDGDLVAVATLPSPASELPRQHGAQVVFDAGRGGFVAVVDGQDATTAKDVFAAGDVTGYAGVEAAARAGARAGRALAATLAFVAALALLPTGCASSPPPAPAAPVAEAPPPPPPPTSSRRRSRRHRRTPRRRARPTRARPCGAPSSMPPGARCATNTTTRRWAASTGTRSAPSTSRWLWARPQRPRSIASSTR